MPVIVVAIIQPNPGRTQDVLDAFAVASPIVQQEQGCELYAAHTDDTRVVVVERWTTPEDLEAHSTGAAITTLNTLLNGYVDGAPDVYALRNVPIGDPARGTIQ